jgi:hypothetical protein
MAFVFIAIDIILRIIVIEKKTAKLYADPEDEDSELPSAVTNDQSSEQQVQTASGMPVGGEESIAHHQRWTEKLPPIVTLLRYPRLLNALWATLMQAVISTSFETTVSGATCPGYGAVLMRSYIGSVACARQLWIWAYGCWAC